MEKAFDLSVALATTATEEAGAGDANVGSEVSVVRQVSRSVA